MNRGTGPGLVWFRQDLRLVDNPALAAAAADGRPVAALYILDDDSAGPWRRGGASRWWLHHSLARLGADLAAHGVPLILRRGRADLVAPAVAAELGAGLVAWNRCYEPFAVARDTRLKADLTARGIVVESRNSALLYEPWEVKSGTGGPFKVYSPFWRAVQKAGPPPAPTDLPALRGVTATCPSDRLDDWGLLPSRPDWAGGLRTAWQPGEAGARALLETFLQQNLRGYAGGRDRPDLTSTSRLSPHLHFGEIGPRQIWHATERAVAGGDAPGKDADKFLSEIGWREFAYHLLFHNPTLPERNFRADFDRFPWRDDRSVVRAWRRGQTGYPIVDAGMRELWSMGWMHNRVRMIAASFLTKHCLVDWRIGEDWFWDTLVDADLANNAASWQWVAGSGADAAPYFRIFNPVLQGERFDPEGAYVRRWVPELAGLPSAYIHKPWTAPDAVLRAAGVELGRTYPHPVVDHGSARQRALDAYATLRGEPA